MTVIKLNASGKAVQVITDEGVMFQTSRFYVEQMLSGKLNVPFILMSRLENGVSPDRFKKSPVWSGNLGVKTTDPSQPLTTTNDAFSVKAKTDIKQAQVYSNEEVRF